MGNYALVVLDETGSMQGQEERVVKGMNEFAKSLREENPKLTVFCFDSERWRTFFDDKARKWTSMNVEDYQPGAMTPLYDAIAKGIAHVKSMAKKKDKVVVMIDTDGYENASKEHDYKSIKALIEERRSRGWQFLFLGSGIDEQSARTVASSGTRIGAQSVSTTHAKRGETYTVVGQVTSSFYRGSSSVSAEDIQSKLDEVKDEE